MVLKRRAQVSQVSGAADLCVRSVRLSAMLGEGGG